MGSYEENSKSTVEDREENVEEWKVLKETAVELWEDKFRSRLKEVDELTLHTRDLDIEDTTMEVRFESDE